MLKYFRVPLYRFHVRIHTARNTRKIEQVGGARVNIYQETRDVADFRPSAGKILVQRVEGSRWLPWIGRRMGWGQDTPGFRDESAKNAWEWRLVKDNRRPVKGSEEQDAVLVHRRVCRWFGARRWLVGRRVDLRFTMLLCVEWHAASFQRRFRLTLSLFAGSYSKTVLYGTVLTRGNETVKRRIICKNWVKTYWLY